MGAAKSNRDSANAKTGFFDHLACEGDALRFLAGDDSVLRYDIATVADMGQSGSGVRLSAPDRGIQRVKLYRYR